MSLLCETCGNETAITQSRVTDTPKRMRRRRECIKCGHRHTTYEISEREMEIYTKLRDTFKECMELIEANDKDKE